MSDERGSHGVSETKIKEAVDESQLENTLFQKVDEKENRHFSSVIKEIKDGDKNDYLIKIRPPFFLIHGFLSNISRALSGLKNTKILDNDQWRGREVEYFKKLYPEMVAGHVPFDNAFLMEKIDGKVAGKVLRSKDLDNEEKLGTIRDMIHFLKELHNDDIFHGEPNIHNCIIGEDGDVYWIDFEVEYDEDLSKTEKKTRDLEQFTLSVLGAFEEEGEIGMTDEEMIEMVFDEYGDEEVISFIHSNHCLPLIGPHRIYQFSYNSLGRFYKAQMNIMSYLGREDDSDFFEMFNLSSES